MSIEILHQCVNDELTTLGETISSIREMDMPTRQTFCSSVTDRLINENVIMVEARHHLNYESCLYDDSNVSHKRLRDLIVGTVNSFINTFNVAPIDDAQARELFTLTTGMRNELDYCSDCSMAVHTMFNLERMAFVGGGDVACEFESKSKIHTMNLEVNDGKLMIANDMRRLFGEREDVRQMEEEYIDRNYGGGINTVNSVRGRMVNTECWEEQGMMYFQADNMSLDYFHNNDLDTIIFREGDSDTVHEDGTHVGTISTNLWAVHAMSGNTFTSLCKRNTLSEQDMIEELGIVTVDVPNGDYECTSYFEVIDEQESGGIFYSIVKK